MKTPQAIAIVILVAATLGIALRCGYSPYPRQELHEVQSCIDCDGEDYGGYARFEDVQEWWKQQIPSLPDAEFSPYCTIARGGAHYLVDEQRICLTDGSDLQEDGTLINVILGVPDSMLDEAVAIVIAHEYGHHVTRTWLFDLYPKIDGKEEEDLADCLSGAYIGEAEEFSAFRVWVLGFTFVRRVGDDTSGIVGRGRSRQKWFRTGVRGGYDTCVASFWDQP